MRLSRASLPLWMLLWSLIGATQASQRSPGAPAQDPSDGAARVTPQVELLVEPRQATLGERIHVTLQVVHDPSQTPVWPAIEKDWGPFRVVGRVEPTSQEAEGGLISRIELVLVAFELGQLQIPSLEVKLRSEDDAEQVLSSPSDVVEIRGSDIDPEGEIRDIKPPLDVPFDWTRLLWWLVPGIAALALAIWAYRRYRRRLSGRPAPPAVPPPPPHVKALQALDELEREDLTGQGRIKDQHTRVSEIIRIYIQDRFGRPALEMTSREAVASLLGVCPDSESKSLAVFFHRCDRVKFAKYRPNDHDSREILQTARRWIEATAEKPSPVIEEPAAPPALENREAK